MTVKITKSQLMDLIKEQVSQILKNPKTVQWGKENDKFVVKFVNPKKGEYLWTGDGWIHQMDLHRDRDEVFIFSKEDSEKVLDMAVSYILRWKPGWEDYLR